MQSHAPILGGPHRTRQNPPLRRRSAQRFPHRPRRAAGGRLFGAVTVNDIAEAITTATGETVDKRTIATGNPIKALGTHTVTVKLHDDVSATVALNVIPA